MDPAENGEATSSSPFASLLKGDEDIDAQNPAYEGAVSRWARTANSRFEPRWKIRQVPSVRLKAHPPI